MLEKYLDRVILVGCIEVLRGIPSDSIDMCSADTPFNKDEGPGEEYLAWSRVIQTIREMDARELFPPQRTSTEKKARRQQALQIELDLQQPALLEQKEMYMPNRE